MRKRTFKIGIALLCAIAFISCEKEDFNITNPELSEDNIITATGEGLIILGKQLEDPYSVQNMEKAYLNMKTSNPKTPEYKIKPTHKYMRFLPANNDEWDLLKKDTTIMLFDFPLDYEVKDQGTYYHDPSLPEDAITWQYCVLPIDYNIPNVQHELIYEVFIPEKDKKSSGMDQFLTDLEYGSVKLTGNLPEGHLNNTKGRWNPEGTIKVWDDLIGSTTTAHRVFDHWEYYDCSGDGELPVEQRITEPIELCKRAVYRYEYTTTQGSYIPLIGAKVSARWFTHVAIDLTNSSGYFRTSSFRYKVNYAIKWERNFYDIRDGIILQAWYNGPKKKGDWNLNIRSGKSIMYATMHRAAHKHYYGNNLGIRRPILATKTKLCYIDEKRTGIFWGDYGEGFLPDIKVWGKDPDNGSYYTTNRVFGTTTHELGHLSHWYFVGIGDYWQTSATVYESWATAVEWALTNHEYHTKGAMYGGNTAIDYYHDAHYQWSPVEGEIYTPIFVDLMDDHNQREGGTLNGTLLASNTNLPNDRIDEYTLVYIQNNILRDAYGLSSLRDALKDNKPSGVTDTDIDELFALYW